MPKMQVALELESAARIEPTTNKRPSVEEPVLPHQVELALMILHTLEKELTEIFR